MKLIGWVLFLGASCTIALFLMLLPISQARDPWQLFFEGGLGDSAWKWGSVAIAIAMFFMMLSEADPRVPRLRRPK